MLKRGGHGGYSQRPKFSRPATPPKGAAMNIREMIASAKSTVVDERKAAELRARLEAAERRFEADSKAKAVNKEFLARTYSL